MSDKPEALRLADALEQGKFLLSVERDATAAELRRLHDLVYKHKWQVRDTCARAEKAEAQRDELLRTLMAVDTAPSLPGPVRLAIRFAIAKATGETT